MYAEQIVVLATAIEKCVQAVMNVRERFFMHQKDRLVLFTIARYITKAIKTAESVRRRHVIFG